MATPARTAVTPIIPAVQFSKIAFATDFSEPSMKALPVATALAKSLILLCISAIL